MLLASGVGRVRLAAARAPAALPAVAIGDATFIADYYRRYHIESPVPAPFDLAMLGPIPATLGASGLMWSGDRLLDDNTMMPIYVRPEVERPGSTMLPAALALPARRERRLGLVFHGWGVRVYGHFLIEMLPKLLLAERFPALFGMALPVLDRQMSSWLIDILERHCGIDPARAIWFDSAHERLDLDQALLLPLLTRAEGYHPLVSPLIDAFAARVGQQPGEPVPRLFVARGDFANPAAPRRRLANEAALADIAAARFGFRIIQPERLSFAEQVGLFAQAKIILGQAGSGMHNALFAPRGAVSGMIRFPAPDQSAIAALRGQGIAYLTEGITEVEPKVFHADPDLFTRFVERLVAYP
ncbi:glycosyltransferase family 61 protein [Acidiphilium sp. PA]|uniref:glycosyltransferase family 61 protein n=1 Tax=Acidiphilium sp. PA TaxID=2871705 RepID=UPI002244538C|nr:glycosyltransferase family 61 protein [Acidiphilium sp. PA]MCW8306441.1 glycosyltransferase family 61 protein [Acidiphilium sp. PA]